LNSCDSICVFNCQKGTKKSIIYGLINKDEKGKETFIYSSQNNNIIFGSPIMSLNNDKIIGIHEKFHKQINVVNLLNYPIESFIKEKTFSKTSQYLSGAPRRRAFKELNDYIKRKINHYNINPRNGDLSTWDITILGPENTPYENGKFILEVYFPSDYPFKKPKFIFKTKIYHPNFRGEGQSLTCCNLAEFEYWSPGFTICYILDKFYNLLKTPIPYPHENCSHVNQECSILMTTNYEKYKEKAKNWTKEFAI
jgi:ubiquitin-conjugating enzyme E2 D/E